MEIVFWLIVAIIVLAIACALGFRERKKTPNTKERSVDLQARRKTYDDVT